MTHAVEKKPPWWQRWLVQPLVTQLTQGISPDKLAWTLAAAGVFGIFPILGSTTIVCVLVGFIFRLNQPTLMIFKSFFYPLHLATILLFIRFGQHLFDAEAIPFSIPQLLSRFNEDMLQFVKDFGMAALHGIVAWAIFAPFLALVIKLISTPILYRLSAEIAKRKEVSP